MNRRRRPFLIATGTGGAVVVLLRIAWFAMRHLLNSYQFPWHERVTAAGYVQKTAWVNQLDLS